MTGSSGKGFTLIEVMAAVALFAVLGIVCLENYLVNMTEARRIRAEETCFYLAREKETQYLLNKDESDISGFFDPPYEDYSYSISTDDFTYTETTTSDSGVSYKFGVVRLTISGKDASLNIPIDVKTAENGSGTK